MVANLAAVLAILQQLQHRLNIKRVFPRYGDNMLKIRRSRDRLIFNMGIRILVRQHFYIETGSSDLFDSVMVLIIPTYVWTSNHRKRWKISLTKRPHKSLNALHKYLTMHHFAIEICTFLLQNGALWDVGLVHFRSCGMGLLGINLLTLTISLLIYSGYKVFVFKAWTCSGSGSCNIRVICKPNRSVDSFYYMFRLCFQHSIRYLGFKVSHT